MRVDSDLRICQPVGFSANRAGRGSRKGPRPLFLLIVAVRLIFTSMIGAFLLQTTTCAQPGEVPSGNDRSERDRDQLREIRRLLSKGNDAERIKVCKQLQKDSGLASEVATDILEVILAYPPYADSDEDECRVAARLALVNAGTPAFSILTKKYASPTFKKERGPLIRLMRDFYRPGDAVVANALCRILKDPMDENRLTAILAVSSPPLLVNEAIPLLVDIAADTKSKDDPRFFALYALGRFGKEAHGAMDAVAGILQQRENDVNLRLEAARSLAKMGPLSVQASVVAFQCLQRESEVDDLRAEAAAIFRGDETAGNRFAPDMIALLQKKRETLSDCVKSSLLRTIADLKPRPDAIPVLVDLLDDEDRHSAGLALIAISKIRPDAAKIVPKFVDAVNRGAPISRTIREEVMAHPKEWERVLRDSIGAAAASELMTHLIELGAGPDTSEKLLQMKRRFDSKK